MNILVTGGAGYIGGTFAYEALKNNHNVLALDNFSNSKPKQIKKLKSIFKRVCEKCDQKNHQRKIRER